MDRPEVAAAERSLLDKVLAEFDTGNATAWPLLEQLRIELPELDLPNLIKRIPAGAVYLEGDDLRASLLGMLLSSRGTATEDLLARYLQWWRDELGREPKKVLATSPDVRRELVLDVEQSRCLSQAILLGHLWSGQHRPGGTEHWTAGRPREMADLMDVRVDLRAFVWRHATRVAEDIARARGWTRPGEADAGAGPSVASTVMETNSADRVYEVALSFAGEQREYVRQVAAALDRAGIDYFFDERAAADMWGEDLTVYLDRVYRHGSKFAVVFVSADYASKVWPRVEFRSALARAIEEKGAYILPVRFDDTGLPGLLPTVGYLDARRMEPKDIAAALLRKLGQGSAQRQSDAPARVPRVPPRDFNPYAETQRAIQEIREALSRRARQLPTGLVGHTEERGERFLLRILRAGTPLYSLDIFLGGGFGDNTICFYGRSGNGSAWDGSTNAHGRVEWDRDRGEVVVRLFNMSLLPHMDQDYRLTSSQLVDAIWNEACEQIERQDR